jgi:hypothetical protein
VVWLGFTACCAFLSSKPIGWVPALTADLGEPLAALRDSTLAGPPDLTQAGLSIPLGGSQARAGRALSVAPAVAVPAPAAAPVQTSNSALQELNLGAVARASLPPVPRAPTEFGRWLPGVVAKAEQRSSPAAAGVLPAPLVGARGPRCEDEADGCSDGSWGEIPAAAKLERTAQLDNTAKLERTAQLDNTVQLNKTAQLDNTADPYRAPEERSPSRPSAAPALAARRAEPREAAPKPTAAPREAGPVTAVAGLSCEAAFATASQSVNLAGGGPSSPDVTRGSYANLLEREPFANCRMDDAVDIQICVAVQNGKAEGVTVTTRPGNAKLSSCVASRVRRLAFPRSKNMDLVRTELTIR